MRSTLEFVIKTSILVALSITACSQVNDSLSPTEPPVPTSTPTAPPPAPEPTREPTPESPTSEAFEQLGITLDIPEGLIVIKEPIPNPDEPDKLDAYTFYIQNYSLDGGPGEDYFQMYGFLQYSLPLTTWEDVASGVLDSDMYAYAEEIEVNGFPGIEAQFSGQRNRYVYLFLLDGRVLNIAVSEPTEANKILADQIISTLQFLPGSLTDANIGN